MAVVLEERDMHSVLEGDSKGKWGGGSRQRELHVHSQHSVTAVAGYLHANLAAT